MLVGLIAPGQLVSAVQDSKIAWNSFHNLRMPCFYYIWWSSKLSFGATLSFYSCGFEWNVFSFNDYQGSLVLTCTAFSGQFMEALSNIRPKLQFVLTHYENRVLSNILKEVLSLISITSIYSLLNVLQANHARRGWLSFWNLAHQSCQHPTENILVGLSIP